MKTIKGRGYFNYREFSTIKELFYNSVRDFGNRTAYKYRHSPKGEIFTKTYTEVKDDVESLGTCLHEMNLQGERISILGDNSYNWAISYFSIALGGSIAVPLDKLLTPSEIVSLLERSQVAAIYYNASFHKTLVEYAKTHDHIKQYICISYEQTDMPPCDDSRFIHINEMIETGKKLILSGNTSFIDTKIDAYKTCALLFTSGTTNMSKCVKLSQANIVADIHGLSTFIDLSPDDVFLSILPLHHTFENTCGLLTTFSSGMCVAYCDGLRYVAQNLLEYNITAMTGVPMLFENIYNKVNNAIAKQNKTVIFNIAKVIVRFCRLLHIDISKKLMGSVRKQLGSNLRFFISGAAALDPKVTKFFDDIGIRVCQGYGLTETSPVIAGCNMKMQDYGTCGHPIPGVEIAIDSDTDEPGEILVKGPIVMQGYLDDEQATLEAIDQNGWFHTGDLGIINKRGNLVITGRLKSMIVLKNGKKVFPEEIEHFINQLDYVEESIVFGEKIDDDEVYMCVFLHLNKELIEKKYGNPVDDETLSADIWADIKTINKQIPDYKKIKYFFYGYNDFAKTTTLKIKRHIVQQDFTKVLEATNHTIRSASGKNVDKLEEL